MNNSYPETWEECKARHSSEAEAKAIWETYERDIKDYKYDARFLFALWILDLINAGYNIQGNMLKVEQWMWISELKTELQRMKLSEYRKR